MTFGEFCKEYAAQGCLPFADIWEGGIEEGKRLMSNLRTAVIESRDSEISYLRGQIRTLEAQIKAANQERDDTARQLRAHLDQHHTGRIDMIASLRSTNKILKETLEERDKEIADIKRRMGYARTNVSDAIDALDRVSVHI